MLVLIAIQGLHGTVYSGRVRGRLKRGVTIPKAGVQRGVRKLVKLLLALVLLTGCARNGESELRAQLDQWFFLRDTAYFKSKMRCTGAMIHVSVARPRPGLSVYDDPVLAREALSTDGVAAIRMDRITPAELTDAMLLAGTGAFGKQALAAGALSGSCFEDAQIGGFLHEALTRPGATLVYDSKSEGMMILDPNRNRLFYVAGDVW